MWPSPPPGGGGCFLPFCPSILTFYCFNYIDTIHGQRQGFLFRRGCSTSFWSLAVFSSLVAGGVVVGLGRRRWLADSTRQGCQRRHDTSWRGAVTGVGPLTSNSPSKRSSPLRLADSLLAVYNQKKKAWRQARVFPLLESNCRPQES